MNGTVPAPVAVVGLGYVGLPLACAFARSLRCIGFDIAPDRIAELRAGHDRTGEVASADLATPLLELTDDPRRLGEARAVIVAVPTPVDMHKRPDLGPLIAACQAVGAHMGRGTLIVIESTVFPGCTEEVCVPALEAASGLRCGDGFDVGYSPERINPGDTEHTLERVVKVVAGATPAITARLAALYGVVAKAGTHAAPTIRAAEAAKVIENTQRDLNIALMNELSMIFNRAGIDTAAVLAAAATKWNFLPFRPGLVGGHCIGVDPYYLTYKAEALGYQPQVILAGRRINDAMGTYVAQETIKLMIRAGKTIQGARVLVLGLTFKENVPDIRNTRVADVIRELRSYGVAVDGWDPRADADDVRREIGIAMTADPFAAPTQYDAVVLAVAHDELTARPVSAFVHLLRPDTGGRVLVDVRGVLPRHAVEALGVAYWSL